MNRIQCAALALLLGMLAVSPLQAEQATSKPSLTTLLSGDLGRVQDTEFVVSRVQIPPNTTLPKHWHPGEEFVYVVSGQVTLWQKDKDELVFTAGEAAKVPLKQVHTAITGEEGVDLVVFRVHEKGQPERVLIDGTGGN